MKKLIFSIVLIFMLVSCGGDNKLLDRSPESNTNEINDENTADVVNLSNDSIEQEIVIDPVNDSLYLSQNYIDLASYGKDKFSAYSHIAFYSSNHIAVNSDILPIMTEITFSNENSYKKYIYSGDPSQRIIDSRKDVLQMFKDKKIAFSNQESFEGAEYKEIGGRGFYVSNRLCRGDIYGCSLILYTTYEGDEEINLSIGFNQDTTNKEMDNLVEKIFGYSSYGKNIIVQKISFSSLFGVDYK